MADKNSPLILGTEPIGKLLARYSIPAIIAMTASSLYNMVDSIFIGHGVGPMAIAGLALTFPLMNLAAAFGSLVGVGASTLVSVKLGQKDYVGANHVLGNVLVLNIIMGILFSVVFLLFLDPVLYFFGASEQTLPYARDYMEVILYGNVVTHIYLGLNNLLRSSGHPKMAMYATLASVVINCALNPLFIFSWGWGIKGSAWATVISQVISLVWLLWHFSKKSELLHFRKGIYGLHRDLLSAMLSIGLSPFLMNLCSCLIVLLINLGLKEHGGDVAIGAYGIVNRISFLFIMINMGLNQGMQPIAGYNYGARKYSRVKEVYKKTVKYATFVAMIGFAVSIAFPHAAVSVFTSDPELIELAAKGLVLINLMLPLVGFQMVTSNLFQCLGMINKSIILSMSRQLLFLLPLLYAMPLFLDAKGIWLSFPLSDFLAFLLTFIMSLGLMKKLNRLQDGDDPSILGSKL